MEGKRVGPERKVSIHFLLKQRKKHVLSEAWHYSQKFQSTSFLNKGRNAKSKRIRKVMLYVSIHFLLKQRKKQGPIPQKTFVLVFQSTSFLNKGRNKPQLPLTEQHKVSIHFLLKQRKKQKSVSV